MNKMKELKLSDQFHKEMSGFIYSFVGHLRSQMKIGNADTLKVSIDINTLMPSPEVGVKYSLSKFETTEKIYDFNFDKQDAR